MPILFDTNYFLRAGERLIPRSGGVVMCDDPDCRIVTFLYTSKVMRNGKTQTKEEWVSGVFNMQTVFNEGTTGKLYRVYRLDRNTGYAERDSVFVIKVMPVSIDEARSEFECLKRGGFAALGSMEEDRSYVVMPYVRGVSLQVLLNPVESDLVVEETLNGSQLNFLDRLNILAQVTNLIQSLHENTGLLHRDITPRNLLVCRESKGLKVKLVDYGDAADIGQESFSTSGKQVVLHLPPETLRNELYNPKSEVYALASVVSVISGAKDPLKDKREAYSRARIVGTSVAAREEIILQPLNLDGLHSFASLNAKTGLNFDVILTKFIRRMESAEPNERPDVDETARFFRCLYYMGVIRNLLSLTNTDLLPLAEVDRFELEYEKYACMLILLVAGKWKRPQFYDCSQVNFDASSKFCHKIMADSVLIRLIQEGEWEGVGECLVGHLAAFEELSDPVLFNVAYQKLLEKLEVDFVNALGINLSKSVAIPVDFGQFSAFFSRLNQLRHCLASNASAVSLASKEQLIAELLIVMHGCWKKPDFCQEVLSKVDEVLPEVDEKISLFDDLCLAEYPEYCKLICDLYEEDLIDAQVLQRLVDQLPYRLDSQNLCFRLRQCADKAGWVSALGAQPGDVAEVGASSSSQTYIERWYQQEQARHAAEEAAIKVEAEEVAKKTMSDIMEGVGFFSTGASSLPRSDSLSVMVNGVS